MSKTFFALSSGDFLQDWSNTGLITTNDDWSGVPSIVGYRGDGATSATGVNPTTITADESAPVNVIANQMNPNTLTTGGVAEFQITDPTVALQGSGTAAAPNLVIYLDATGRQDLNFSVDLRDVDGSTDNAVQPIAVQYRVGDSGSWTNINGGYVADASTGPSQATQVTHLSLALPSAVNNANQVEIRVLTTNAVGNDEWIGVDNIHVTSNALAAADTTPPHLVSTVPVENMTSVSATANLSLTFDESVKAGAGAFTLTDGNGDTRTILASDTSQVSFSGATVTINPTADLMAGDTYHLSVDSAAVTDTSNNAYAGTGTAPVDFTTSNPAVITHIYDIQGAGLTSPLVGQQVTTQGVVTAVDTTGSIGFYIQDPTGDGDIATSDGVFVFTNSAPTVHVGDLVQLGGTVAEYNGGVANNLTITEINSPHDITTLSTGNVIAPTVIGEGGREPPTSQVADNGTFDPVHSGIDFYESLEGMLVTVTGAQATDSTYQGSTWVVADHGAAATGINANGGITISATDFNPEKIQIYADSGVDPNFHPAYGQGDTVGNVTGVVTYYGGEYEVDETSGASTSHSTGPAPETTALAGNADHLSIGSFNVETLDPSDTARIQLLGQEIAHNLGAPDILGLEEIEDADGAGSGTNLSGGPTLDALVAAIVQAGGPQYSYVEIDPTTANSTGGEPNGNIRDAFLYDPTKVSYVAGSATEITDTNPANGDAFHNSRMPLVADFDFHGDQITAISVHNYSRGGSEEEFGAQQPPVNSGDQVRTDQSDAIHAYVQQLQASDPSTKIVVAGDFNGFYFEPSLTDLEQGGSLTNLVETLPSNERYSYEFEGNSEQLDNLLVSSSLSTGAQFDDVHLNSGITTLQSSDHDPILSLLTVNEAPTAVTSSYSATSGSELDVSAANGVLAGDSDPNGDSFTAALATGPAHGALTLNADGSFAYTPTAGYTGPDSFAYTSVDSFGAASSAATVALTVAAPTMNMGAYVDGSGTIYAQTTTGEDTLHGDPTTNNTFIIDKSNLVDSTTTGGLELNISDFYGANGSNSGDGTGHQDYLVLTGFSSSAQLSVQSVTAASGGAATIDYDILDGGKHYDFSVYSENGAQLAYSLDYYGVNPPPSGTGGGMAMGMGQYVSGSGTISAQTTTGEDTLYGDPTTNNTFVIDRSNLVDSKTTGGIELNVADFYGANQNTGGDGTGHQDYLVLKGFSDTAQLTLQGVTADSSGTGATIYYDILDRGNHYDFSVHSQNGGSLVSGYDYYVS